MRKSKRPLYEKAKLLVDNGASIAAACREIGLNSVTYQYFRKQDAKVGNVSKVKNKKKSIPKNIKFTEVAPLNQNSKTIVIITSDLNGLQSALANFMG